MSRDVIAFDVGGTTTRMAVVTASGDVIELSSQPTPNYVSFPGLSTAQLQSALTELIIENSVRLRSRVDADLSSVAVSIGAAVNARTGTVMGRGPLWGAVGSDIDLAAELAARDPSSSWLVVNDLTASVTHHAHEASGEGLTRLSLLTVSTGIALRTFDFVSSSVPVDPVSGLQGEVGHRPIAFSAAGGQSLRCDCGGLDHLNAYCSGRGIESVLLARGWDVEGAEGDYARSRSFARAVKRSDRDASALFRELVAPVAETLLMALTVDPAIGRVVVQGGVPQLFSSYRDVLVSEMARIGLYGYAQNDRESFDRLIDVAPLDGIAELRGAARLALMNGTGSSKTAGRWTVRGNRSAAYRVSLEKGMLSPANPALAVAGVEGTESGRRLVIADIRVAELYGQAVIEYFVGRGIDCVLLQIDVTEDSKSLDAVENLLEEFEKAHLGRRELVVVAMGGGVLLDLVGVAASLFRRGVPYLRVPTTLLGVVDAGVGVKVGVNLGLSKNRLGAFHPPAASIADLGLLKTLPTREVRNGLAEIVKIAIARDRMLFDALEREGRALQDAVSDEVVQWAIGGMLAELAPNLWEDVLDRPVDLGHSFGPRLELDPRFGLRHGESVSIDIVLSAELAHRRGMLPTDERDRIVALLSEVGLPTRLPGLQVDDLRAGLVETARHRGGRQRVPLPLSVGVVAIVNDITQDELAAVVAAIGI